MQPIIGVTSTRCMVTSSAGETRAHVLYTTYTGLIREVGGIPVETLLDSIDGLLLSGGGDIDPRAYGGIPHESVYAVDPLRDEFELGLARGAAERYLPTLAICRGMQITNVAFGGTLFEDIKTQSSNALEHRRTGRSATEPQHSVELDSDSTTANALGKDLVDVNTIHHQAVRVVAQPFRVTGQTEDGIIESMEPIDSSWPMWGVQWHPEWLGKDDEPSFGLFRTFVAAATDRLNP